MPFTYDFLVDGNGNFVVDENGDKIIIAVNSIQPNNPTRRALAGRKPRLGAVMSFDIRRNDQDLTWHLTINKQEYVGRFPNRDDAIAALFSMATACNARDEVFDIVIDQQLARGVSFIDSEGL